MTTKAVVSPIVEQIRDNTSVPIKESTPFPLVKPQPVTLEVVKEAHGKNQDLVGILPPTKVELSKTTTIVWSDPKRTAQ